MNENRKGRDCNVCNYYSMVKHMYHRLESDTFKILCAGYHELDNVAGCWLTEKCGGFFSR